MKRHLGVDFFPALGFILIVLGCGPDQSASPPKNSSGAETYDGQDPVLTFTKHIAPIVFKNCASCHRPGESAPFSLLAYEEVKKRAEQIVAVIESGFMPPWLPNPEAVRFREERLLTDEEKGRMIRWVKAGAPQGNPRDLPSPPEWTEGWRLGEPDLVVTLNEPYHLAADGPDVFRNFVIPIPIKGVRYVQAVEFRPANPKVIHHATMKIDPTDASRKLAELDPLPGFDGMKEAREAVSPDGQLLGWTPGKVPDEGDPEMAWRLTQGDDLVVQIHMLPSGKPEMVQPSIGFFFAEKAPSKRPVILHLGSRTLDIPPNATDYRMTDTFHLPVAVQALSVYPHAHYLGKEMNAYAKLPGGTTQSLIHIPDWDFNWQDQYRYQEPVFLPPDSMVVIEYSYDNSENNTRNPNHPPERVVYGPQSSDEMGDLWLQVLAGSRRDRLILERAAVEKNLKLYITGYEFELESDSDNAFLHEQLAGCCALAGVYEKALRHYQLALRIDPDFEEAYFGLGNILRDVGQIREAEENFRKALERNPDYAEAHNNLAVLLQAEKKTDEAMKHYRRAIDSKPDYAEAHYNLANAFLNLGRFEEAIRHYEKTLDIRPDHASALNNLGTVFRSQGHVQKALNSYRQALEADPFHAEAHNSIGAVFGSQGHFAQAIEHFRMALQLKPDYLQARQNLDRALQMMEGL